MQFFTLNNFRNFKLYGGFENSKRKIVKIYPYDDYIEDDEFVDFPFVALKVKHREVDKLSHRDFLGSLMAFQIKRDFVGDIVSTDGYAIIYIYDTVAEMILNGLTKVGRVGVKVSIFDEIFLGQEQVYKEIRGSVASLRLDCILSLALNLSREKSCALIKNAGVDVNYRLINNASVQLKDGDKFSLRGYGKFIFDGVVGTSKKGRFQILVKKFI